MLYEIEQLSTPIDELRNNQNKSYRWLMDNTVKINMASRDVLEEFYRIGITSSDRMYDYNCSAVWGEASGNYRFRFLIVKTGDDFVLVPFKVIDPRSSKIENYFSISYPPISYNSMSTDSVLSVLKLYPSIKSMMTFSRKDEDYINDNFYNKKEDFDAMNRSSWRSKNGINKMLKLLDVITDVELLPCAEDDIKTVIDYWNIARGSEITSKPDIGLLKIARKSDKVIPIIVMYKDRVLAYTICSVGAGNNIFCDVTKSLSICSRDFLREYLDEGDDSIVNMLKRHLGHFVNYLANRYAFDNGYDALYYYGSGTSRVNGKLIVSDPGLDEFKNSYFKHNIYYRRIKL